MPPLPPSSSLPATPTPAIHPRRNSVAARIDSQIANVRLRAQAADCETPDDDSVNALKLVVPQPVALNAESSEVDAMQEESPPPPLNEPPANVKSLDLGHKWNLGPGAAAQLEIVLGPLPASSTLLMLRNHAGDEVTDPGICATLKAILDDDVTLTDLDLSNNPLGDDGAITLCRALRTNTSLLVLKLNQLEGGMGAGAASALANALHSNGVLTRLEIAVNRLSADRATEIMRALLNGSSQLRSINLAANWGASCMASVEFAQAIAENPYLTSIDLYGNRLDEDALKVLRDVTRRRHKWFKLEGPPSGKPSGYN
jgi:hypothetical protein